MVGAHHGSAAPDRGRERRRRIAANAQRDRSANVELIAFVDRAAIVGRRELEGRRRGDPVDCGVQMPVPNRADDDRRVGTTGNAAEAKRAVSKASYILRGTEGSSPSPSAISREILVYYQPYMR